MTALAASLATSHSSKASKRSPCVAVCPGLQGLQPTSGVSPWCSCESEARSVGRTVEVSAIVDEAYRRGGSLVGTAESKLGVVACERHRGVGAVVGG